MANRLRDDPMLRLASNPLFMMGMMGLQGSNPSSGAANPFGGFAGGLQSAAQARAQMLQPEIEAERREAERAQALEDAKARALFEENLRRARPQKPPSPGALEKARMDRDKLIAQGAPQADIDLSQEYMESIAKEERGGGNNQADLVRAGAEAAISGLPQPTKSQAGEETQDLINTADAINDFSMLSSAVRTRMTNEPNALTAMAGFARGVSNVERNIRTAADLAGYDTSGVSGDVNSYSDKAWGPLIGANATIRSDILSLATAKAIADGMGRSATGGLSDSDVERALESLTASTNDPDLFGSHLLDIESKQRVSFINGLKNRYRAGTLNQAQVEAQSLPMLQDLERMKKQIERDVDSKEMSIAAINNYEVIYNAIDGLLSGN